MVPLLVAANYIVWKYIFKTMREDKRKRAELTYFDQDMHDLSMAEWKTPPPVWTPDDGIVEFSKKFAEQRPYYPIIDDEYETWPLAIYCNGRQFTPGDPESLKDWMEMKNICYLKGDYNSIPLDDGGKDALLIDWFRMKGYSDHAAQSLVWDGAHPQEYRDLF